MQRQPLNPIAAKIMRMILDEGFSKAEDYVAGELTDEAEQAKALADRALTNVMAAKNIIQLAKGDLADANPRVRTVPAPTPTAPSSAAQYFGLPAAEQRQAAEPKASDSWKAGIVAVAAELAAGGELVTTASVMEALKKAGTPPVGERPATSIGNVLARTPGWERVGEGVYQLKKA